ncbi:AMP-binding protein [Corynebacterium choanae]|uniref:Long-chain-fatty-acid--CoA ligase n=1 Tax=Corynebacterium choanae TaxID=1862358 RepID=A0A3G6J7Q6_9CORY|nr:AMP-binding protein [Corynebacterium choanae]AZA12470.1 Long-chain-fatty-acid--CoA ligase [Corynebacterium choanae]
MSIDLSAGGLLPPVDPAAGTRPALLDDAGNSLSHSELRDRIYQQATMWQEAGLSPAQGMVHLPFRITIDHIISYYALRALGIAVLITAPDPIHYAGIVTQFVPAAVIDDSGTLHWSDTLSAGTATPLPEHTATIPQPVATLPAAVHPATALLLSTSGSTGAKKLVRLSTANVAANTRDIVDGLNLRPTDRAITALPLHYCFGLSVLHTHLYVGGSVVVSQVSMGDHLLVDLVQQYAVTTFAVVPHMLDLVEATGGWTEQMSPLRLICQAGGKLSTPKVTLWAQRAAAQHIDFRPMYGQTEATARMAIMPQSAALTAPQAAGLPVGSGKFRIENPDSDGIGELVYSGPNVMMGYALTGEELALGPMLDTLHTGDRGYLDEHGFVVLAGRRDDFFKIAGLRIAAEPIAAMLAEHGVTAHIFGDDRGLVVLASAQTSTTTLAADTIVQLVGELTSLSAAQIMAAWIPAFPLLPNGKIDRRQLQHTANQYLERQPSAQPTAIATPQQSATANHPDQLAAELATVCAVIGTAVGRGVIDPRQSFVHNGGTSLSQVTCFAQLAQHLGPLPRRWAQTPIDELLATIHGMTLADYRQAITTAHGTPDTSQQTTSRRGITAHQVIPQQAAAQSSAARRGWRRLSGIPAAKSGSSSPWASIPVDVSLLIRAIAAITIVATHTRVLHLMGGAHSLLVVAGFSAALFAFSIPSASMRLHTVGRTLAQVAIPTAVIAIFGWWFANQYSVANIFLIDWLWHRDNGNGSLWFIESYCTVLLVLVLLLAHRGIYALYARQPFLVSAAATAGAVGLRYLGWWWLLPHHHTAPWAVAWLVTLGVTILHAQQRWQQAIVVGLFAVGGSGFFFFDHQHTYVAAVVAALLWLPQVRIPQLLLRPVAAIASASLYIYLLQFTVFNFTGSDTLRIVGSILLGIGVRHLVDAITRVFKGKTGNATRQPTTT